MPAITEKQIFGWAQGWAKNKGEEIVRNFMQKGGWEGWAQVELANVFQTLPGDGVVNVEREVHAYQNARQAVDIKITDVNQQKSFLVELKCESLFASADSATQQAGNKFYLNFQDDIQKLRLRTKQQSQPLALMFIISDEARRETDSFFGDSVQREDFSLPDGWTLSIYLAG
ncbi:hypothetical protein ONV78_24365 [Hahella sp. CR1]|uniref:hypothetical protein n=1 Tax=Hahella sp. CR1 TaxID=2992807 RepID=UPI002442BFDB|nr:hypothetical protein [Hahella sp. CR1]MDG9670896.1 hypothetical protein [Hahella sp. CR1]